MVITGSVLSAAGCAESQDPSTVTASDESERGTDNRNTISAIPEENCPDSPRVPEASPHPDGEEIPPLPEYPESLDEDQLTEYVRTYEFVYRWREKTQINNPIEDAYLEALVSVRSTGPNWVILDVTGRLVGRIDYEPTITDSPGTFDDGEYRASYLVTSSAVWRAEGSVDPNSRPNPIDNGKLLQCH